MRKCDNCKGESGSHIKKERVKWNIRLAWPPIKPEVVEEWWCRRCYYHRLNGAASPRFRRNMHANEE